MNSQDMKFSQLSPDDKRKLLAQVLRRKASAIHSVHPLSAGQQALWFQHQLAPESASYNVGFAARIVSEIDNEALKAVFATLVDRHPMLRTTYGSKDGNPFQVIHGFLQPVIEIYNVSGLCDEELSATVNKKYAEPFDIEKGPVIRVHLFSRTETDHVLLLCIHHIACDGWSIGIILNEFRSLYAAKVTGQRPNLIPLNNKYTDFIEMQSQMLTGKLGERLKSYWTNRLSGDIPLLRLPLDRPRFGLRRFVGATHHFYLEKDIYQRLNLLAKLEGVTLYILLLSAFQTLLLRYSSQDDILVGTPVAGRVRSEYEAIVGFFINQVVMRGDLSGNPSFRQVLINNRTTVLEAIKHQEFPFPSLVDQLKVIRDPSHYPIFQVLFNLLKRQTFHAIDRLIEGTAVDESMEFGPLKLKPFLLNQEEGQFDLALEMVDTGVSLLSSFRYNSDIFNEASIVRIAKEFSCLIESILSNPDQSVWELKLSLDVELQVNPAEPIPPVWCGSVCERFSEVSRQHSERTAVVDGFGSLSYGELERYSNWVANRLLAVSVGSGDTVAVYGHRSAGLVLSLMGILKAGAAFLILDPAYPPARLAKIMQVAQPSGLLLLDAAGEVVDELREVVDGSEFKCRLEIPRSKDALNKLSNETSEVPQVGVSSEHVTYLIFTSGTTGEPKGIIGTHGPLSHFLEWHSREFDLNGTDRFSMLSGLSHDPLLRDIFTPLWVGGTLCIPDPDEMLIPARLRAWMKDQKITATHMTPALGQLLSLGIGGKKDGNERLTNLRYVFFGGDSLTWNHVEKIREIAPAVKCVNFYGATETPQAMGYEVVNILGGDRKRESIPLGKGIEGVQLLVVNPAQKLAGVGELGEIYVRTPYLTKGYVKDEVLTRERYIPNPFNSIPSDSDRLYRTGDLGRYLPDGRVMFCGRADSQVSIRGFRVELKEIEAILAEHPDIRDCAVISQDRESGDKNLAAYVVGYGHKTVDTAYLREYLGNILPDYMIPSIFVQLDELPLTPNGKIDLTSLPVPEYIKGFDRSKQYEPPRYPTEELLVEVWSQILGVRRVGVHDNFFERGGHSLMATQVISRISDLFHLELPLRAIFETLTIAKLAERIQAQLEGADNPGLALSPITPVERSGDLLLSYSQERLWFLQQLEPESTAYSIPGTFRLKGILDKQALEQAFAELARRHETLRTTFRVADGRRVQIITQEPSIAVENLDLRSLPVGARETEALRLAHELSRKPFDLASGPLLRISLFQLDDEYHVMHINMHHIISDYWSFGIMNRELVEFYKAFIMGTTPRLPDLPVQYADFAYWQRQWLQGETLNTHLGYWKEKLGGELTTLNLVTDRTRPAVQSHRGATESLVLSQGLIDALRDLSHREGSTLFMTMLAVFNVLLFRITGQDDIVLGTPASGRNKVELEGLIGFFMNTIVMRTDLSGNPTFKELLTLVRENALGAYTHQEMPFEKLVEELAPERDMSRTPLFQIFFNYIRVDEERFELPGVEAEVTGGIESESKFDMTLYVWEQSEAIRLTALYNADLFDNERIAIILDQYQELLKQVAENPEERIINYSLLTPSHEKHLPDPACRLTPQSVSAVHQRFSEQAHHSPENVAIVDPWARWSYGELDRFSNQLANYLLFKRIQPGDVVAIYGHRSAGLVLSLLGILKAGAAFLILDPAYPPARQVKMMQVAQVSGLLLLEAAWEIAGEFRDFIEGSEYKCKLEIPRSKDALGLLSEVSSEALIVGVSSEHIAYLIFTSGTTGEPKGIIGTHGPLSHFLEWHSHEFDLNGTDRFSMLSGLSHDPLLRDIFTPLWVGGTLYIPDPDEMLIPDRLRAWMANQQITVAHMTPALGQLLSIGIGGTKSYDEKLPNLRYVFFGGDTLTLKHVEKIREIAPAVKCVNFYGATETPQAMGYEIVNTLESDRLREFIPLGKGIEGVQLLVVNSAQKLAGVGELGEIYIRTPYLTKGYLNDEALSQERFVSNPFTGTADDIAYITGDLGRYLLDGRVMFYGRADEQVSIRGFRVELKEIEAIFAEHPDIRDCVIVMEEKSEGKRLIAYIVPEKDATISSSEIRVHLKRTLPDYMIPSIFVALNEIPITPNGKIDRLALPVPDGGQFEDSRAYVAPSTPLEETIAEIWKEVLEVDHISVHDNFFEVGGHSLLSMQVISRLEKKIGLQINPREFVYQTLGQLAASIEGQMRDYTTKVKKNSLWLAVKSRLFK